MVIRLLSQWQYTTPVASHWTYEIGLLLCVWATGSTSAAAGSTQPPSAANTDVSGTQQVSSQASANTTPASTLINSTTNIATTTSAAGELSNIIYSYVVNNAVLRFPGSSSAGKLLLKFSCMMQNNVIWAFYLFVLFGLLCVCVNAGINVSILTMHVNVVMGGQLGEHLLFWQPTISTTLYAVALYLVWFLRRK